MALTYEPIATTTLGSATATVTFSSISSTYTDLILICYGGIGGNEFGFQVNGDTGTNYSYTTLAGNGTAASSTRNTNYNGIGLGGLSSSSAPAIVSIQNYSNTTTNKTILVRGEQTRSGVSSVIANVGLWRNTNAITSIVIKDIAGSNNISSGSTFTLYGIKSA